MAPDAPVAQLDRAAAFEAAGRRFDSCQARQLNYAGIRPFLKLPPRRLFQLRSLLRRYFIEYETSSVTINDAKKSTSARAKLDRYVAFFHGNYRTHFRDGWRPRLLFVSQSEARAASIAELLNKEGFPSSGAFGGRALTLDGAKQFLMRKLTASQSSPRPSS